MMKTTTTSAVVCAAAPPAGDTTTYPMPRVPYDATRGEAAPEVRHPSGSSTRLAHRGDITERPGGESARGPMMTSADLSLTERGAAVVALGMAYVWGREDAGDREATPAAEFAGAYALADTITHGRPGPVRTRYQQWCDTGQILVREPGSGRGVRIARAPDHARPALIEACYLP